MERKLRARLESLPKIEASFVEPMECLAVSKLPEGPNFVWEVFAGTAVSVYALVCAGVRGLAPYKDIVEGLSGLPILDADRLELSLKLLMAGRERDFFSFLWNPVHSELRPLE